MDRYPKEKVWLLNVIVSLRFPQYTLSLLQKPAILIAANLRGVSVLVPSTWTYEDVWRPNASRAPLQAAEVFLFISTATAEAQTVT